jgi:hypothetical protein
LRRVRQCGRLWILRRRNEHVALHWSVFRPYRSMEYVPLHPRRLESNGAVHTRPPQPCGSLRPAVEVTSRVPSQLQRCDIQSRVFDVTVSQICAGTGKHCPTNMGSEGTPEIVLKDPFGYYFVTFHGCAALHCIVSCCHVSPSFPWVKVGFHRWNGQVSARGVAKSLDFVNWVVDDGLTSLPADAIFTSIDCNPWNISWAQGSFPSVC